MVDDTIYAQISVTIQIFTYLAFSKKAGDFLW